MSDTDTLVADLIDSDAVAATKAALNRVKILPHPFSVERIEKHVDTGQTVFEMMGAVGCKPGRAYLVFLNGVWLPPEMWKRVRPKPHAEVVIKAVPMDSGNGDENKTLRTILQVVVIIVALVLTAYGFPIAGAVVSIVGNLAVMALLPPKFPKPKQLGAEEPGFSISGSRNVSNPGGAIPRVYGKHRMFPFYAARSYTEIVGHKQYLRMLFTCGHGPLQITALRIGETPIEQFDNVEVEIREGAPTDAPLTLFSNTILEEVLTDQLQFNVPVIRTTETDTDEISYDIVFPGGLFDVGKARETRAVEWVVDYAPTGTTTWTRVHSPTAIADTSQPYRDGHRWIVPRGQYDVRLMRRTPTLNKPNIAEDLYWSALRSIKYVDPIPEPNMSKIAVRIRATEQLRGVIDTLSCLVEAKLRTWSGTAWTTTASLTRNPASAYLDILTGEANKRPIADTRIDLAGLGAWYTANASAGRNYDAVVDYRSTVVECLHDVAVAGRAAFAMPDGKYGVIRDILQTVPVQVFTPRNSWGFTGRKVFPDPIDGFRMPFVDATNDYQAGEVKVYDDGVDPETATNLEMLQLAGITDPDALWREGRYHLACLRLRPEMWDLNSDVENLVCQRGDLVHVQHDVLLVGLASGRVKALTLNVGGNATGVTIDERVTMETGTDYGIRFRRASDGGFVMRQVTTVDGADQNFLDFTTNISSGNMPAVGDLFYFGELGTEYVEALVKAILPGRDLSARLELVPAGPGVHTADTGEIPPYNPVITLPPHLRVPPAVRVDAIVSDSRGRGWGGQDLGTILTVLWSFASGEGQEGATLQAQWQESERGPDDPWVPVTATPSIDAMTLDVEPLTPGTVVDVRLRSVSRHGIPSVWVTVSQIRFPNPPRLTTYTLEAITGGYRARIARQIGPPPPPRVTGLRLVNGATGSNNDTEFLGRTAKFKWNDISLSQGLGDGEDDLATDPDVTYRVQILTGGEARFTTIVASPDFEYTYALNVEDHIGSLPARDLTIRVWVRTAAHGLDGVPAELSVFNRPASWAGFMPLLEQRPGGLHVDCSEAHSGFLWTDPDRDKWDVLLDTFTPPTTAVATRSHKQKHALIPNQPAGTTLYVRIAPHDAFGVGGIGTGVRSQTAEIDTTPTTPADVIATTRPSGIALRYTRIPDPRFEGVEVWRATSNDRALATLIESNGARTGYLDTSEDLISGALHWYWLRTRDVDGTFSPFHAGDTNGTRARAPVIAGYSRVGSGTPFAAGQGIWLAVGVDTVSNELDILQVSTANSDIYWGEATLSGTLKTAQTSTIVGTWNQTPPAVVFDGSDLQCLLIEGAGTPTLQYVRLSAAGAIESGPTTIDSNVVGPLRMGLAYDGGSALYATWLESLTADVRFATLNLSGVVQGSITTLWSESGGLSVDSLALAVDDVGDLHFVYTTTDTTDYAVKHRKYSAAGALLAGPTTLTVPEAASTDLLIMLQCRATTTGQIVALILHRGASGADRMLLTRILKSGAVPLHPRALFTFGDQSVSFSAAAEMDPRNDNIYLAYELSTGAVRVERFERVDA